MKYVVFRKYEETFYGSFTGEPHKVEKVISVYVSEYISEAQEYCRSANRIAKLSKLKEEFYIELHQRVGE